MMHQYRGTRVAVLGASGFIGRWVARTLCMEGALVHLFVRDKARAEKIFSRYGIHGSVFEIDLLDFESVFNWLCKIRPVITFNLAGYGVDRSERDEMTAYQINAHLINSVCAAVADAKDLAWAGQDIVHVGSALEYGEIRGNLAEDSVPNPTTLYGKSKLAGTRHLADACRLACIKGLTARLFTVYGPGEHRGRLLPSLLEVATTARTLSLTAGKQKRDFVYVEDVAAGLLRLGLAVAEPGQVVNLATGRLTSVQDFAEIAAKILQIPADRLKFGELPTRAEEMQHAEITLECLKGLISWVPSTTIEDGIRKTVEFEKEYGFRED